MQESLTASCIPLIALDPTLCICGTDVQVYLDLIMSIRKLLIGSCLYIPKKNHEPKITLS